METVGIFRQKWVEIGYLFVEVFRCICNNPSHPFRFLSLSETNAFEYKGLRGELSIFNHMESRKHRSFKGQQVHVC